jgi:hypothetical protein
VIFLLVAWSEPPSWQLNRATAGEWAISPSGALCMGLGQGPCQHSPETRPSTSARTSLRNILGNFGTLCICLDSIKFNIVADATKSVLVSDTLCGCNVFLVHVYCTMPWIRTHKLVILHQRENPRNNPSLGKKNFPKVLQLL